MLSSADLNFIMSILLGVASIKTLKVSLINPNVEIITNTQTTNV